MKFPSVLNVVLLILIGLTAGLRPARADDLATNVEPKAIETLSKSDTDQGSRAAQWAASLNLNDAAKEARVTEVIATHLKAVRDWHNDHSYTNVPAGVNPATGKALSVLDREMIADSAIPKSVHQNLMAGLRKDLTPEQVEAVLDKYTVGKVEFTMTGYRAIVPDLTPEEEKTILGNLKQAREQAVDYKNMQQISAIFKIYKTQCEQYLNSNGRDWHKLYKTYVDSIIAKKAAAKKAGTASTNSVAMPE